MTQEEFEKGLMLAGLLTPVTEKEIEELELIKKVEQSDAVQASVATKAD